MCCSAEIKIVKYLNEDVLIENVVTMKTESQKNDLSLFQRRMEIIVGAELREENRMHNAVKIQDNIRAKIKSWNGSNEIRKWREKN